MKIVNTGEQYDFYGDSLKVYDVLPAQTYQVIFSPKEGFHLGKYSEVDTSEPKIYGPHVVKVEKVFNAYKSMTRNLGVILSGAKGIGKTLFAKLLAQKALEEGYPLIVVDAYYPGIASFLEQIDQKVMILFDEFEKTFKKVDGVEPMNEMLPLFDGLTGGNKLFVVTCNEIRGLNDFLVNRPGRFHYHFRFEYPLPEEIADYLHDKLSEEYYREIPAVINFSRKVSLNFDCLRAIAFELNTGLSFPEAIKDLNILDLNTEKYDVIVTFRDGSEKKFEKNINMFSADTETISGYDFHGDNYGKVSFIPVEGEYDALRNCFVFKREKLTSEIYIEKDNGEDELVKDQVIQVIVRRQRQNNIHYVL